MSHHSQALIEYMLRYFTEHNKRNKTWNASGGTTKKSNVRRKVGKITRNVHNKRIYREKNILKKKQTLYTNKKKQLNGWIIENAGISEKDVMK